MGNSSINIKKASRALPRLAIFPKRPVLRGGFRLAWSSFATSRFTNGFLDAGFLAGCFTRGRLSRGLARRCLLARAGGFFPNRLLCAGRFAGRGLLAGARLFGGGLLCDGLLARSGFPNGLLCASRFPCRSLLAGRFLRGGLLNGTFHCHSVAMILSLTALAVNATGRRAG